MNLPDYLGLYEMSKQLIPKQISVSGQFEQAAATTSGFVSRDVEGSSMTIGEDTDTVEAPGLLMRSRYPINKYDHARAVLSQLQYKAK